MSWAVTHKGLICMAASIVHGRALSAGVSLELDDLIQDGSELALKLEPKFDPTRGAKPSTYLHTALMRHLNKLVDYAIYAKHHEPDGIETREQGEEFGDDLQLWDFLRQLSKPSQMILMNWLMPSEQLHREIRSRTVGRRCSLKAMFHYLREQGHDADKLKALEQEIFTKAGLYES